MSKRCFHANRTFPANAHLNTEASDFGPKEAPGIREGRTKAPKTPTGSRRDKEYITKLPINCPSGRYVINTDADTYPVKASDLVRLPTSLSIECVRVLVLVLPAGSEQASQSSFHAREAASQAVTLLWAQCLTPQPGTGCHRLDNPLAIGRLRLPQAG